VRERVHFLLGTFTSAEGTAVSAIAKDLKVLFMAPVPATDRLTAPDSLHPYIFRVAKNTTTEGRAAAEIMAKWQVTRVGTIAPDYAYGQDAVSSFVAHLKKLRPDVQIVDQQWPKLNEPDYSAFVTAQTAARPEAVLSVICCGNFDAFAKQARPLGYFDALKHQFIGLGEAGSVETLRSLGKDYPVGVWGNTYDAFNWDGGAAHKEWIARLKKYLGEEYPSTWPIQGYIAMQFLADAIGKTGGVDALKVSEALKGMTIQSAQGPITIRAKDQQATRGMLWGKSVSDPKYPFPVLDPVMYIDPAKFMD
jgi:branched-chain amino acid transport system substrate-binding protein